MTSPEERFDALFESTHLPLIGYAARRVADPSDAADIVAETFLVAWRRLEEVPPDDQARPWLFGVARRVLANYYRGQRRQLALADRLRESLREVATTPPDQQRTTVEIALESLSEDDRELIRLVAWEDLAREEIALVMGLSRGAVRVRLHRARTRLRQAMRELDDHGDADPARRTATKRIATSGHDSGSWALAHRDAPQETS